MTLRQQIANEPPMPAIEYLTATEHQRLQKIDDSYGQASKFQDKAGLARSTFKNVISNGYGLFETVQKIRDAFAAEDKGKAKTIDQILEIIAEGCGVSVEALKGKCVTKDDREGRQTAALVLSLETKLSDWDIAVLLGYGSHASTINAKNAISKLMTTEHEKRRMVWAIREKIQKN